MKRPTKVYLTVPYEEKDKAKGLGAKWDPRHRCWYVPEESELAPFERWLPNWVLDPGDTVRLPVLLLPTMCDRCRRTATRVIGLGIPDDSALQPTATVDDVGYVALQDCEAVLDALIDPSIRTPLMIGPVLPRRTQDRPEGYLANSCFHCGSTQQPSPRGEELVAFVGGDLSSLWSDGVEVEYPLAALGRREPAQGAGASG